MASALSLIMFLIMGTVLVYAQGGTAPTGPGGSGPTGPGGSGPTSNISIIIPNPFDRNIGSLFDLIKVVVNEIILPIGGVLAVLAFIYSGFLYVMAQGNETKLKTAHQALLYTAIGTAVLLGSWTLANVIKATINQLMT